MAIRKVHLEHDPTTGAVDIEVETHNGRSAHVKAKLRTDQDLAVKLGVPGDDILALAGHDPQLDVDVLPARVKLTVQADLGTGAGEYQLAVSDTPNRDTPGGTHL